jgi:hypothetical protein
MNVIVTILSDLPVTLRTPDPRAPKSPASARPTELTSSFANFMPTLQTLAHPFVIVQVALNKRFNNLTK